jgi:hypothetical protein
MMENKDIKVENTKNPHKEIKNRVIDLKEYERLGEIEAQKENDSLKNLETSDKSNYMIKHPQSKKTEQTEKKRKFSANSSSEFMQEKIKKIPGMSKIIPNENKTKYQIQDNNNNSDSNKKKEIEFGSLEKFFILVYIIFLIGLIGFINLNSDSNIFIIFISLLPTFFTIILTVIFFLSAKKNKFSLLVLPVLTAVIWYIVASNSQVQALKNVDAGNTTFLNFILSLLFIVILEFLSGLFNFFNKSYRKKEYVNGYETIKTPDGYEKERTNLKESKSINAQENISERIEKNIEEQEKSIEHYIQSIEDKSKAINFVIGRVYSKKHGGSPELRSLINIKKEWYNLFAEIPPKQIHNYLPSLREVVFKITEILNQYQKTEKEIFGKLHLNLENITRDESGNNTIIEVLINNDKDPVEVYYKTALEFCEKAITEIDILSKKKQPVESNILGTTN